MCIRDSAYTDEQIITILAKGAEKVRPLAQQKIDEVSSRVGFTL